MKTTKDKKHGYGSISNLRDLRAARERVDWELSFREKQISGRLPSMKKMFSVGNITSLIARRADDVQMLALTAINTFELLRSKFRGDGKKRDEKDDGQVPAGSGESSVECRCECRPEAVHKRSSHRTPAAKDK